MPTRCAKQFQLRLSCFSVISTNSCCALRNDSLHLDWGFPAYRASCLFHALFHRCLHAHNKYSYHSGPIGMSSHSIYALKKNALLQKSGRREHALIISVYVTSVGCSPDQRRSSSIFSAYSHFSSCAHAFIITVNNTSSGCTLFHVRIESNTSHYLLNCFKPTHPSIKLV